MGQTLEYITDCGLWKPHGTDVLSEYGHLLETLPQFSMENSCLGTYSVSSYFHSFKKNPLLLSVVSLPQSLGLGGALLPFTPKIRHLPPFSQRIPHLKEQLLP